MGPPMMEFEDRLRVQFTRKIAEGGMGSVYEALLFGPEGFEKVVCVKVIKEKYGNDKEYVARFIGEAKLVADLVHQNIVQIYKLGKVQNLYHIIMEYVHGINLQDFMNRHIELGIRVPVEIGAFIISRVCRGLEYAHNKRDKYGQPLGVVHRDISPKNLMLSSEGEVKICDFGVAKAKLMRDDEGQVIVGKIAYLSPEQAQFQKTDKRSDIFSLSIVMYELLTGERLFGGVPDTKITLESVMHKEIPPPRKFVRDIPEALEKIMLRGLERDQGKRYQDAGMMGYDLEYFMYHKGYGPTIQTLADYLRQLFPHLYQPAERAQPPAMTDPSNAPTLLLDPDRIQTETREA